MTRDYKAEYRRRIERGLGKGLSRAQARGHRRAAETRPTQGRGEKSIEDAKLQFALRMLRKENSLTKAAKEAHIAPERLRRIAVEKGAIEKQGRRWVLRPDLPRRVLIFTREQSRKITVGDISQASLVGKYMSAVGKFLSSNNKRFLVPFAGNSVTDINGRTYRLETDPNALYRLSHSGGPGFEDIYRIVV